MLQPVRTKWRKAHKGRIHGTASRANFINYGAFALKAMSPERVTGKQIEAARVALTRHMKRQGRVWTRVFPNIPVSKKPIEVRMGKGKGNPEFYACRVKPGRIIKLCKITDVFEFKRRFQELFIKNKKTFYGDIL